MTVLVFSKKQSPRNGGEMVQKKQSPRVLGCKSCSDNNHSHQSKVARKKTYVKTRKEKAPDGLKGHSLASQGWRPARGRPRPNSPHTIKDAASRLLKQLRHVMTKTRGQDLVTINAPNMAKVLRSIAKLLENPKKKQ